MDHHARTISFSTRCAHSSQPHSTRLCRTTVSTSQYTSSFLSHVYNLSKLLSKMVPFTERVQPKRLFIAGVPNSSSALTSSSPRPKRRSLEPRHPQIGQEHD